MRDLLGRVARAEGALGAALLTGLLACGLILIAALTLEDSQVDRRSEAIEIRTLVASGHGIAPELLPQLFVSFVTTKPRGTGTGLGLRICRRIVEEMGGSISAANRAEGGACFEILLPAARRAAEARAEAA